MSAAGTVMHRAVRRRSMAAAGETGSCTGPRTGILCDSQALTEGGGNPDTAGTV